MAEDENQKEDEQAVPEETEPQEKTEEPSEKGLGEFRAAAVRGPKRGIYQQLLAQGAIKANRTNDRLIKIATICENAYLSRQKDKLDMNHVDICYAVCCSFQNTHPKLGNNPLVRVAWSFPETKENWERHIEPWQKTNPTYLPLETPYRLRKYPLKWRYSHPMSPWERTEKMNEELELKEKMRDVVDFEIQEMAAHERFFEVASALTEQSFDILQGEFTLWAIPKLLEIQAIISDEIDPQVWREALGIFGEEQEEEE